MERAKQLVGKYWKPPVTAQTDDRTSAVVKRFSADNAEDWSWITDFIERLPVELARQEDVQELGAFSHEIYAFAMANSGRPVEAIASLEALIELFGPTPERLGILGGRYKRLCKTATTPAEQIQYLARSIDAYERGMELDLNDYYCSSNLPRLYKARKRKGDEVRARSVLAIVIAACERAKNRGVVDDWLLPTLLAAAFDAGDCDKAEELAAEVAADGAAHWKLNSLLQDLKASVAQVEDKDTRDRLQAALETLQIA